MKNLPWFVLLTRDGIHFRGYFRWSWARILKVRVLLAVICLLVIFTIWPDVGSYFLQHVVRAN